MEKFRAELKFLRREDGSDLAEFRPENSEYFGEEIGVYVQINDLSNIEYFCLTICTPQWFSVRMGQQIASGRYTIFMPNWGYESLFQYLKKQINNCEGNSWEEVMGKVGTIARWGY